MIALFMQTPRIFRVFNDPNITFFTNQMSSRRTPLPWVLDDGPSVLKEGAKKREECVCVDVIVCGRGGGGEELSVDGKVSGVGERTTTLALHTTHTHTHTHTHTQRTHPQLY